MPSFWASLRTSEVGFLSRINSRIGSFRSDLLECSEAAPDALKCRLTQETHAFFLGQLADFRSGLLIQNQLADRVGQIEQLMNRGSAAVTGPSALHAASTFAEAEPVPLGGVKAADQQSVVVVVDGVRAVFADGAHQSLGQNAVESGYEVVGLDAHVEEAAEDVDHVVGVDGGEDEVAGKRGVDGDLRRLLVADFADENLVRVVAQN